MPYGYQWAAQTFSTAKNPEAGKPLENNTRLYQRGNDYAVRLHDTDVVVYHPDDSITLYSGGWLTVTTKDRWSSYTPARVYSNRGAMTLYYQDGEYPYADGITIHSDGTVTGAAPESKAAQDRKMRTAASHYANDYVKALYAGEIDVPSGGDCWFCLMRDSNGKPVTSGSDYHMVSHIEEPYYVPSLVWNAMERFGGSIAMKGTVASLQQHTDTNIYPGMEVLIRRTVRRWVLVQCGLSA